MLLIKNKVGWWGTKVKPNHLTFSSPSSQAQVHSFISNSSTSPRSKQHREDGELGLQSLCNSSSLLLSFHTLLPSSCVGSLTQDSPSQNAPMRVHQAQLAPAWATFYYIGHPRDAAFVSVSSTFSSVGSFTGCSMFICSNVILQGPASLESSPQVANQPLLQCLEHLLRLPLLWLLRLLGCFSHIFLSSLTQSFYASVFNLY